MGFGGFWESLHFVNFQHMVGAANKRVGWQVGMYILQKIGITSSPARLLQLRYECRKPKIGPELNHAHKCQLSCQLCARAMGGGGSLRDAVNVSNGCFFYGLGIWLCLGKLYGSD